MGEPGGSDVDVERVAELLGRGRAAHSTWWCATPQVTRSSCATLRSSTTAHRCRPATTSSATRLVKAVSRVESAGAVDEVEAELDDDADR